MEENFNFDREKFKDIVHYIVYYINTTDGRDALGNTKLHKVLYFSDVLHYLDKGKPLTGEDYLRQKFGPTSRRLSNILQELESERRVCVKKKNYYGYSKCEYAPIKDFKSNRLSTDEVSLIQHIVNFVCKHTANEISEFSHDDVWSSVPMGERIPYFASYATFPAEVRDEDIEEAINEVVVLAPMIKECRDASKAV